ncbi:TPA: iron-containing alcohol dehydrogenase, partial [Klebsiella michiganensis]
MQDFIYHNPVKILFGRDQISALAQEVPQGKKVMIVYGGGSVIKHGILKRVKESLTNTLVYEFGGVEANPHYETLMKAVEIVRAEKIDFLLAVGGGSVIDGTKFVAAAALYENDPWEIVKSYGGVVKQALPFGCVLTLAATGSEMNNTAVITLAIVMPALWRLCKKEKAEKLAQYGARVWNIPESDSEKMADEAINATVEFFELMG